MVMLILVWGEFTGCVGVCELVVGIVPEQAEERTSIVAIARPRNDFPENMRISFLEVRIYAFQILNK
jgi:hypothetical protein